MIACLLTLPAHLLAKPLTQPDGGVMADGKHTDFSSADFLQTRRVKALDRPLVSRGSFQLTDGGFVWTQQTPFQNTLAFDGDSVVETTFIGNQSVTRRLQDPVTTQITRTLFDMMRGSWSDIRASFHIMEESGRDDAWTLRLIPIDPAIAQIIPEIMLSGSRFLETIELRQDEDTVTLIELSRHQSAE